MNVLQQKAGEREGKIEERGRERGERERGSNKFCSRDKVFAVDELATPLANAFFIKAADPLYESVADSMERDGEGVEGGLPAVTYS